jgi:hypothetical protein
MAVIDAEIKSGLLVCLSICAADGLISIEEEKTLEDLFFRDLNVTEIDFKYIVDSFFSHKIPIEDYLQGVEQIVLKRKFLTIAKEAAAADGLDITENIALEKCKKLWEGDFVSSS